MRQRNPDRRLDKYKKPKYEIKFEVDKKIMERNSLICQASVKNKKNQKTLSDKEVY